MELGDLHPSELDKFKNEDEQDELIEVVSPIKIN